MSGNMTLYIDGDAFPNALKPIVHRSIIRLALPTVVVSNKRITIGDAPQITYVIVEAGADEADHRIVEMVQEGDLVLTADIPLADRVIAKNAHAIDHRGERYSKDNIKQFLAMRNLMETLRDSGEITQRHKPFGPKDTHAFANQFNAFLAKQFKGNSHG